MIYEASEPISSLPELLEEFAKKIADLEKRVADLEKTRRGQIKNKFPRRVSMWSRTEAGPSYQAAPPIFDVIRRRRMSPSDRNRRKEKQTYE